MRENEASGNTRFPTQCGPVAQLGARFHGMEEVVGSIPTRSTISFQRLACPHPPPLSRAFPPAPNKQKARNQPILGWRNRPKAAGLHLTSVIWHDLFP